MLDHLDSGAVRRWVTDALAALAEHRDEIDRLNVYPVPDSDTGTNMYLTLEAAADAAEVVPDQAGLGPLSDAVARGALLGARGNSGIILSQILRGCADAFGELPDGGPVAVRRALRRAADQAYAAVSRPVEGTMLTVTRAAADGATDGAPDASLRDVVEAAVGAARSALARTTGQLEVLARAGVVDAGGKGVVVVLESLWATVQGLRRTTPAHRPPQPVRADPGEGTAAPSAPAGSDGTLACAADPAGASGPAYEVMYLLETGTGAGSPDDAGDPGGDEVADGPRARAVASLRVRLDALGDSLAVVGGPLLWNVHVHTDQVGEAIRAGREAGVVRGLRVTSFAHQRSRRGTVGAGPDATVTTAAGRWDGDLGVVVAGCDGLAGVLADHGARTVLGPAGVLGWDDPRLTEDVRQSLLDPAAGYVLLVPDRPDAIAAADRAAALAARRDVPVTVLPASATVQVLSAVAVHDPSAPAVVVVDRMRAAMAATRCATVRSERRTAPMVGSVGATAVVRGTSSAAVAEAVLAVLVRPEDELVTLVTGDVQDRRVGRLARAFARTVRARHPHLEVTVVDGDLPGVLVELGVE